MSDVSEWTRAASEDEGPAALMLYQSEDR
jgi:hypothetical protein